MEEGGTDVVEMTEQSEETALLLVVPHLQNNVISKKTLNMQLVVQYLHTSECLHVSVHCTHMHCKHVKMKSPLIHVEPISRTLLRYCLHISPQEQFILNP